MGTIKTLARVGSKVGWALITVVAVIGLATAAMQVGVKTGAIASFHVTTWSMEPALDAGDLIISRPTAAADVELGDIVTVEDDNSTGYTTHRVYGIEAGSNPESRTFTLKGDANEHADALPYDLTEVFVQRAAIPGAGAVMDFVSTPPTSYYLLLVFAALLVLTFTAGGGDSKPAGRTGRTSGRRRADEQPHLVALTPAAPAAQPAPPPSGYPSRRDLHRTGGRRGRRAA